jgi:putative hemolysin
MSALTAKIDFSRPVRRQISSGESGTLACDLRYEAKIATTPAEITSALRLRYEVFGRELKAVASNDSNLDIDGFDLRCQHLIVTERNTGRTIGTYRLNCINSGEPITKLYSHNEFTIEDLPESILRNGMEAGRACVAVEHRGSRVLFLMWKALSKHLNLLGKRYIFGCCSILTTNGDLGRSVYRQLRDAGHVSDSLFVRPRNNAISFQSSSVWNETVRFPPLFEMYLRLGAKVCGPPMYDESFGSIDFFVLFDNNAMAERYRRLFLS